MKKKKKKKKIRILGNLKKEVKQLNVLVCSLAGSFLIIYSNCVLIDTCFSSNIMPEIHVVYAILKKINAIMP